MSETGSAPPLVVGGQTGPISTYAHTTGNLRYVVRDGAHFLQQEWRISEHDSLKNESHEYAEWRDVPVANEADDVKPEFTLAALYAEQLLLEGVGDPDDPYIEDGDE